MALRWVRRRLGWIDPVRGALVRFRVHVRYSVGLIAALTLLVLAPSVEKSGLGRLAMPLLFWLGSACFLAGVGCLAHAVFGPLRRMGREGPSVGRRAGLILAPLLLALTILFAPVVFVEVGLIDMWFDTRKLSATKGEL